MVLARLAGSRVQGEAQLGYVNGLVIKGRISA